VTTPPPPPPSPPPPPTGPPPPAGLSGVLEQRPALPPPGHQLSGPVGALRPIRTAVRQSRTHLANTFIVFIVGSVFFALVLQEPALLGLGAPFLLALVAALLSHRDADLATNVNLSQHSGVIGDVVDMDVELHSTHGIPQVEVELVMPYRLQPTDTLRAVSSLGAGVTETVSFPLKLSDWGVAQPSLMEIRTVDRFGLLSSRHSVAFTGAIRINMPDQRMRSALDPDRFRQYVGSHQSLDRGSGVEIADNRPYRPGDPMKALNWRISNRRQAPWITLRHPDRSSTVVVVVDPWTPIGPTGQDTRSRTVQAAVALSRTHLNVHDRVGLLVTGKSGRWIQPQLGSAQMHRIADMLLELAPANRTQRPLGQVNYNKVIPLEAVVVVVSPLLDQGMVTLIANLRSRGRSVSVLQPLPVVDISLAPESDMKDRAKLFEQAARIFALEQEVTRSFLQDRGVAVMGWESDQPVEVALEGMRKLKRARSGAKAGVR